MIYIWEPKYSTNEVLIGAHKIVGGENLIQFTKARHLKGAVYKVKSEIISSYPKQRNGNGYVYVVPFDKLECITQPA